MKKKHYAIIILSTLSVIGIIFLQINWIQNVVDQERKHFEVILENSIENIKKSLYQKAIIDLGYQPNNLNYENSAIQNSLIDDHLPLISKDDIEKIIKRNLNNNNISLDFEFAITKGDIFRTNSNGYKHKFLSKAHCYPLNNDKTTLLYLYLKDTNAYIIRETGWNIAASILFTIIIFYAFILTNITLIRLRQESTATTDFFNNMTHEFKTPIATINIAVDTLKNEKVQNNKDKQLFYISIIKEENNRMLKLIQRILESAKSQESKFLLNTTKLDLHDIITSAVNSVNLMLTNHGGSINLQLNATHHYIYGDEIHLTNIFNNLLDNAIKYKSNDTLNISITTSNTYEAIQISIQDNGIGMTHEAQKNIFKRFYRVTTGNMQNIKGFGLGLSYVKTVIESHNGNITVNSILHKGTTFTITLPCNY